MTSKIRDTSLPNVWACEDNIFNICMNEIKEFPQYITKLDDIKGKLLKKNIFRKHTLIWKWISLELEKTAI